MKIHFHMKYFSTLCTLAFDSMQSCPEFQYERRTPEKIVIVRGHLINVSSYISTESQKLPLESLSNDRPW